MADVNKVFLIGRLTQDPELRYTPNGAPVSDLRLATSRQYTTKDGSPQKETLYIDVTVWNRQAENCCQYLKKGRMIHVEGYLKMDSWDDRTSGEKRTKVKVEAERVQFLDSRRDEADSAGDDEYSAPPSSRPEPRRSAPPANSNGPARGGPAPAPRRPAATPPEPEDQPEDDIPF